MNIRACLGKTRTKPEKVKEDALSAGLHPNEENQAPISLSQRNIDIILIKVAEGKRIVVYGNNKYVKALESELNIDVAYYVDDMNGTGQDNRKRVGNIYDVAFEKPSNFLVVVFQPEYSNPRIFKTFTELGFLDNQDYLIVISKSNYELDGGYSPFLRDPYLGFGRIFYEHDNKFPGFKVHGDINKDIPRIVTLGGSTTDAVYAGICPWPEILYHIMKRAGIEVTVFNGGFASYSSPNEFIKLVRDVLPLSPSIIISYSGINDMLMEFDPPDEQSNRYKRPFVGKSQENIFNWISQKEGGATTIYGIQTEKSPAEYWIDIQRMMHSVSGEFGIKYMALLQANCYSEGLPSGYLYERTKDVFSENWNMLSESFNSLKSVYDEMERKIAPIPYILNFRHIFADFADYDIYQDFAHVYEWGNQIIAANVFENLIKMGYLDVK
jgi:lysophospholipase L1-like esterase